MIYELINSYFIGSTYYSLVFGAIFVLISLVFQEIYIVISKPKNELDIKLLKKCEVIDRLFPNLSCNPFVCEIFACLRDITKIFSIILSVCLIVLFSHGMSYVPSETYNKVKTVSDYFYLWSLFPSKVVYYLFFIWFLSLNLLVVPLAIRMIRLARFYESFKCDYSIIEYENFKYKQENGNLKNVVADLEKQLAKAKLIARVMQEFECSDYEIRRFYGEVILIVKQYGDQGFEKVKEELLKRPIINNK